MIYINGTSGFIGGNLFKTLKRRGYQVEQVARRLSNIKNGIFIQMASPSDKDDFINKEDMKISMIDDVEHNIDYAIENNLVFVFCSSLAAENPYNDYGKNKAYIENLLKTKSRTNNLKYIILRIPRVYAKNRKKGLMKQLRNNEVDPNDYDNIIEFMEIDDFIEELIKVLGTIRSDEKINKIIHFNTNFKRMTIREIKNYFEL